MPDCQTLQRLRSTAPAGLVRSSYYGHLASNLPRLPAKAMWGNFDADLLETREGQLTDYLAKLLMIPRMAHNQDVLKFLGIL